MIAPARPATPPGPQVTVTWEPGTDQWVVLVDTSEMPVPEPLRIEIDGGVLWDNENHRQQA